MPRWSNPTHVFMFHTGVLLAILEKLEIISPIYGPDGTPSTNAGTVSAGYQNFLVQCQIFFFYIFNTSRDKRTIHHASLHLFFLLLFIKRYASRWVLPPWLSATLSQWRSTPKTALPTRAAAPSPCRAFPAVWKYHHHDKSAHFRPILIVFCMFVLFRKRSTPRTLWRTLSITSIHSTSSTHSIAPVSFFFLLPFIVLIDGLGKGSALREIVPRRGVSVPIGPPPAGMAAVVAGSPCRFRYLLLFAQPLWIGGRLLMRNPWRNANVYSFLIGGSGSRSVGGGRSGRISSGGTFDPNDSSSSGIRTTPTLHAPPSNVSSTSVPIVSGVPAAGSSASSSTVTSPNVQSGTPGGQPGPTNSSGAVPVPGSRLAYTEKTMLLSSDDEFQ